MVVSLRELRYCKTILMVRRRVAKGRLLTEYAGTRDRSINLATKGYVHTFYCEASLVYERIDRYFRFALVINLY